jgi:hypothetical protein
MSQRSITTELYSTSNQSWNVSKSRFAGHVVSSVIHDHNSSSKIAAYSRRSHSCISAGP